MSLEEKDVPLSGPENGPDHLLVSNDVESDPNLDRLQRMSYLAGRSPSGSWSLVSLLDAPPGPEPSKSP